MPDAEASRKRQISDRRIPSDLTTQGGGCEFPKLERRRPDRLYLLILICDGAHLRRRSGNAASGIFSPRHGKPGVQGVTP